MSYFGTTRQISDSGHPDPGIHCLTTPKDLSLSWFVSNIDSAQDMTTRCKEPKFCFQDIPFLFCLFLVPREFDICRYYFAPRQLKAIYRGVIFCNKTWTVFCEIDGWELGVLFGGAARGAGDGARAFVSPNSESFPGVVGLSSVCILHTHTYTIHKHIHTIHIHTPMHAYIHTHTHMRLRLHTYMHMHMPIHVYIHIHPYIYIYMYVYIHTHMDTYITLHYITLHYIILHYITLHCIALHCITLHYIALQYITLHYITFITLH